MGAEMINDVLKPSSAKAEKARETPESIAKPESKEKE